MNIKKLNEDLTKFMISEGILDNVKEKVKGLFNKEPINYIYKANGNVTFNLAQMEQEVDGYYVTQYELFDTDGEMPLYDVQEDVIEDATDKLIEQNDLVNYLDEDLKKVIISIDFNRFETEEAEDTFEHYWDIKAKRELTAEEMDKVKKYLDGQMSDGLGEGFEQRPYKSDEEFNEHVYIKNPEWIDWNAEDHDEEDEDDEPEEEIEIYLEETLDIDVYIHLWHERNFKSEITKA